MADDHSQRAYRSNEFSRGPMKGGSANDPLAELARLIGQNDPFAEFGRKEHQAPAGASPHQDQWAPQPYATETFDQRGDFHAGHDHSGHDHSGHAQGGYDQHAAGYDTEPYYQDDQYRDDADQAYDDDPPPRRRLSIVAIAAVVALAVVGTAGAVGYRALFGSSGSSPPPVIKADATPTKVVPAAKSEPSSNKLIYDRVGERSSGEKLVSREEQPIDINKPSPQGAFPNAIVAGQAAAMTPGTSGAASLDQPKKIHTIPIRPDQPMNVADAAPQSRTATTPAATPMPRAAAAQQQRVASAPPVTTADAEDSAPVTRSTPARAPAPSRGAPLSLNPNAAAPAPQPEPVRTASTPPARNAPPAAATSASGQYAVQISSQRSEAEAAAAFRALQAKYPSQLGGRQPVIRRADLGDKGTYYRALVGPFANGSDAVALCQSLKTAGGSCLIQKN